MFCVGNVPDHARRLIRVTQECLYKAIDLVRPGVTLGDIGHIIQQHGEANHYSIVREYCGHGIGRIFHEEPQVLHYGRPYTGTKLVEGMTFTIEPMLNAGSRHTKPPKRWLDRNHKRSQIVRTMGAYAGRHWRRLRDSDAER